MEVNVDTLEQVELIDLGDQDGGGRVLALRRPSTNPQTSGTLCFGPLGTGRSNWMSKLDWEVCMEGLGVGFSTHEALVLILEVDLRGSWVTEVLIQISQKAQPP